jgi:phosphate starvation-inducible protein PhoH and related proteins
MGERIFSLESYNPLEIYGVNDVHLELVKKQFPKLKIVARGDMVKAFGEEDELAEFEKKFSLLLLSYDKFGRITEMISFRSCRALRMRQMDSSRNNSPMMCWSMAATAGS